MASATRAALIGNHLPTIKPRALLGFTGFWSRLNYATRQDHMIGRNIDAVGKIAAVRKSCDAEPSTLLVDSTLAAYIEMAKDDAEKH